MKKLTREIIDAHPRLYFLLGYALGLLVKDGGAMNILVIGIAVITALILIPLTIKYLTNRCK